MKDGLVLLAMCVAVACVSCSAFRCASSQTVLVAGGKCVAKLKYDEGGKLIDVDTEPPCVKGTAEGESSLRVNGQTLVENTCSITFGTETTTCYGPPIPSPPICICTRRPCP